MADRYYVTTGNWGKGGRGSVSIVVRIDIPVGTNSVGVEWQTAATERWSTLPAETQVTQWPGDDTTNLANGTEHEFLFQFQTNRGRSGIVAELEAAVATEISSAQTRMQDALSYWGKTG